MNKKIFSIITLIFFIVIAIIFLRGQADELKGIFQVNIKYIIPISLFVILGSIFNGHKLKILMDLYHIPIKFKECWGLQIITLTWNYIVPFKAGFPARAIYLKKKYNFPYTFSVSITGIAYLYDFMIYGLTGIILTFFLSISNELKYSLLVFFIIIFIGSFLLLFFIPPINTRIKFLRYVLNSINELKKVRKNIIFIFTMGLNSFLRLLFMAFRLYFAFLAFNIQIPLHNCLLLGLFLGISVLISITPMSLGFRESIIVISSKLFGIEMLSGLFVATLDRVISILLVFIIAPIFIYTSLKNFRNKDLKNKT